MKTSWRNIFNPGLTRKYGDAIDYLDENYAFFLTHVLNIGKPRFTDQLPTAAVALPDKDASPQDFEFLFNENFLDQLDTQSTAFILAHETLHIVLNHLVLARSFVDYKAVEKLQTKRKDEGLTKDEAEELAKQLSYAQIFNIAADCVINDYLKSNGLTPTNVEVNLSGDPKQPSSPLADGLMWGQKMVGHNCANATVTEVFDELLQKIEDFMKQNQCQTCGGTGKVGQQQSGGQKGDKQQGGQGDQQEDGEGEDQQDGSGGKGEKDDDHQHGDSGQPCPDCNGSGQQPGSGIGGSGIEYKEFDSHDWMHDKPEAKDLKNLEDLWDQVKDEAPDELIDKRDDINYDSAMKMAGDEAGAINEFAVEKGVSLAWIELLKEIDPDLFKGKGPLGPPPKASWHQRPRKLGAMPEVMLPVKRVDERRPEDDKTNGKKPSIVMALDTSGSISRRDAARFIALAQSVPQDKMHLFPCTFTTEYNKLDLDNPRYGSGGTSFSAIERFIQREVIPELGHYPKAVVVITDGYASFDREKVPAGEGDSWFWLLTENGGFSYYGNSGIGETRNLDDYVDKGRW